MVVELNDDEEAVFKAALRHVDDGAVIFPADDDKRPLVPRYTCASGDPSGHVCRSAADVYEVWGPGGSHVGANIAGVTGSRGCCGSGWYVLDPDVKAGAHGLRSLAAIEVAIGAPLPRTRKNRTPSAGFHLFFAYPDDTADWRNIQNRHDELFDGLDVRGHHGYVMLPGSKDARGVWETVDDAPIAAAPAGLLELTRRVEPHVDELPMPPHQPQSGLPALQHIALSEVAELAEQVAACAPHTKSDTLFDRSLKAGGWLHHLIPAQRQSAGHRLLVACDAAAARHQDRTYDRALATSTIRRGFAIGENRPKRRPGIWLGCSRLAQKGYERRGRDDRGNGYRLLDHYGGMLRYITTNRKWAAYADGVWGWEDGRAAADALIVRTFESLAHTEVYSYSTEVTVDDEGTTEREDFLRWTGKLGSRRVHDDAVSMAAKLDRFQIRVARFDTHPWLLNVRNGVIDLRDPLVLCPHDSGLLLTKQTTAGLDLSAACPWWDKILTYQFEDEDERRWVESFFAYAALREGNYRKLAGLLLGTKDTGKSRINEALIAALGSYCDSFEVSLLRGRHSGGPRPDWTKRMRKRLLVTTEANDRGQIQASHLKRLTGGDTMSARELYSNAEVSGVPSWTALMALNNPPDVAGLDDATLRRLVVIPWSRSVPEDEQVLDMPALLAAEKDGILLRLLTRLADENVLDVVPERFRLAKSDAAAEMSTEAQFLAATTCTDHGNHEPADDVLERYHETCRVNGGHDIDNDAVFRHYLGWCDEEGVQDRDRRTRTGLGKVLGGLGWPVAVRRNGGKARRVRTGRCWQVPDINDLRLPPAEPCVTCRKPTTDRAAGMVLCMKCSIPGRVPPDRGDDE